MTYRWQRLTALLRPGPDDAPVVAEAPGMQPREVLRRFWPDLRPLRWWLLLGLVLLLVAPAIEVVEILLFQRLVDDVLVPASFDALPVLILIYLGLNALSAVVSGADDYVSTWVAQSFLMRLRERCFAHVLSLPLPVLARRRLGDVLERLTGDVAQVERFMVGQLTEVVGASVRLVFFVGALFWLDWQLAAAALVVVPLFWWVSTRFGRRVRTLSRERRRRGGSLASITEESLGNAALVQATTREADALARYHRQNRGIVDAELASSRVRGLFLPLVDLTELVGILAVVSLGVWALDAERLTLGGLLAFLTLMAQSYRPARDLGDLVPALFSATAGVERIVELLDEEAPRDRPGAEPLPPGPGAIGLRDVTVSYPGSPAPVLSGLSLDIAAGERVAIVGPSGSGKSTLAFLLTRHLEPDAGRVLVDGHDVADHTIKSVRRTVGVVLQETMLVDGTVHENIAFAVPEASDAEVRMAARRAGADDFIRRMAQGYRSRIGQRGRMLSGGQRQRLSVARALLRESPVLVLDEPTTGLDAATSRRMLEPLLTGPRDRTVLVLTHDPLVLEYVDRVIELPDPATSAPEPESLVECA